MRLNFSNRFNKVDKTKKFEEAKGLEEEIGKEVIPKIKDKFKRLAQSYDKGTEPYMKEHREIIRILSNLETKPSGTQKDLGNEMFLYNITNQYDSKTIKFNGEISVILPLAWTHLSYEYKADEARDIKEEYSFLNEILGKEFGESHITNFPNLNKIYTTKTQSEKPNHLKLPLNHKEIYNVLNDMDKQEINKENIIWTNFQAAREEKEIWGYVSWMKLKDNEKIIRVELSVKEPRESYLKKI